MRPEKWPQRGDLVLHKIWLDGEGNLIALSGQYRRTVEAAGCRWRKPLFGDGRGSVANILLYQDGGAYFARYYGNSDFIGQVKDQPCHAPQPVSAEEVVKMFAPYLETAAENR
ncbi:MAG: hypothetical protein Q3966_07750 [Neisseria sp.]|nr:hypothetical protein [Neisseria sp.]